MYDLSDQKDDHIWMVWPIIFLSNSNTLIPQSLAKLCFLILIVYLILLRSLRLLKHWMHTAQEIKRTIPIPMNIPATKDFSILSN